LGVLPVAFVENNLGRQIQRRAYVPLADCAALQRAEVGYFIGLFYADYVLGFNVAVNEPIPVDSVEPLGGVQADIEELSKFDVGV
jgi:hypothetical protein